jgi:hypothetical protein
MNANIGCNLSCHGWSPRSSDSRVLLGGLGVADEVVPRGGDDHETVNAGRAAGKWIGLRAFYVRGTTRGGMTLHGWFLSSARGALPARPLSAAWDLWIDKRRTSETSRRSPIVVEGVRRGVVLVVPRAGGDPVPRCVSVSHAVFPSATLNPCTVHAI